MPAQVPNSISLFDSEETEYGIATSSGSVFENEAQNVITNFFYKVSGKTLKDSNSKFLIKISDVGNLLPSEAFTIKNEDNNIIINGNGKGVVYGAYTFAEEILGCRKFFPKEPAYIPTLKKLNVALPILIEEKPAFIFREVYSMAEGDEEYLNFHKIHHLEKLWGLWGHSFRKMLPDSLFVSHPEYFAFYRGKRQPSQPCLSNDKVYNIFVEKLEKLFAADPKAKYWSISPNDNREFCKCDLCKAKDAVDGGNQGQLITFVNRIAKRFPEKTFTTLAYTNTAKPPLVTIPEKNVIIFLSNIEIKRKFSADKETTAETFRKNLKGWSAKTNRIFLWDYYTQFTNFLAPFPNYYTYQSNIKYYKQNKVQGVFAQLNGPTYGDFAGLKTYLLAKLLWNPQQNQDDITHDFLTGYYENAAPYVKTYLDKLHQFAIESAANLDIYGNPVNNYQDFLNPRNGAILNQILDKAIESEKEDSKIIFRLQRLKLPLEYTYLQHERAVRLALLKNGKKNRAAKNAVELENRVKKFTVQSEMAGVRELSEEGLTPKEYLEMWQKILYGHKN